jgi:hypothetical protein
MTLPSVARFLLADCYPMSGWHGIEVDPRHGPFRWSGPAAVAQIALPIAVNGPLQFRLHVIHQVHARVLNGFLVRINGQDAIARCDAGPDGTTVIAGDVPAPVADARDVRLELHLQGTARPDAANGSRDSRELGVAVSEIAFGVPTLECRQTAPITLIISSTDDWEHIQPCVEAVLAQARLLGAEVIVASAADEPVWPADGRPRLRWVTCRGATTFELRAAGIAAATGDVVAITEDHCEPRPDWASRILDEFRAFPRCLAVGGAVVNGTVDTVVDRASFEATFARYAPDALTAPIPCIANLALRREWATIGGPAGWLEFEFLPAMARLPGAVRLSSQILTVHSQPLRLRAALGLHYDNGRSATGLMRGAEPRSLARAVSEGWRMLRSRRRSTRNGRRESAGVRALVSAFEMAHAVGVAVGAYAGAGHSAHRLM